MIYSRQWAMSFLILMGACSPDGQTVSEQDETKPVAMAITQEDTVNIDLVYGEDVQATVARQTANIHGMTPIRGVQEGSKLKLKWENNDLLKFYFTQGTVWDSVFYQVKDEDIVGQSLKSIRIRLPNSLDVQQPYGIYAVVGKNAFFMKPSVNINNTAENIPKLICPSGRLRSTVESVAHEDMVITFRQSDVRGTMIQLKGENEGTLFVFDAYTEARGKVENIVLKSAEWQNSRTVSSSILRTDNDESAQEVRLTVADDDSDIDWKPGERNLRYAWVRTVSQATGGKLTVRIKSTWASQEQYLKKDISFDKSGRGFNRKQTYRIRFNIYEGIPYSLPNASYQVSDWMKNLSDDTPVNDLLIPGTHDAGANDPKGFLGMFPSFSKTQSLTIEQQLAQGVRALDVRAKYHSQSENDLWIYHGPVYMGGTLTSKVLEPVKSFLDAHPTECVFMLYKNENGDLNKFKSISRQVLARYAKYLYTVPASSASPLQALRLKDIRGKIVLLTREGLGDPTGADERYGFMFFQWGNNEALKEAALYAYQNIQFSYPYVVQDRYENPGYNAKKVLIQELLDQSEDYYLRKFWIFNYLSYSPNVASIQSHATQINGAFYDSIGMANKAGKKYRGILLMDFAGNKESYGDKVLTAIIDNNFKGLAQ